MDKTNLNVLKMLEPKKYDKPKKKTALNKLFDMKNTHVMPNGEIHTGKTHTKNSRLVKCPKGKKICNCKKKPKCVSVNNKNNKKNNKKKINKQSSQSKTEKRKGY